MKKRNILKRNSGFIAASIVAAGASFFTADMVLRELSRENIIQDTGNKSSEAEPEIKDKKRERTYETDPFTITANGAVISQVESEKSDSESESGNTDAVTGETAADHTSGNTQGENQNGGGDAHDSDLVGSDSADSSSWEGSPGNGGSLDSGSWNNSVSNEAGDPGNGSGNEGFLDNGSEDSGSGNGGLLDNGSWNGGSIEIIDPGNGSWSDSSSGENWGGSSGSSAGESSWGSSSGDSSSGSSGNGSAGGTDNGIYSPDDLILWHINSRYIGEEELYNFDAAAIRLIRNEIFALHGRIFRSVDLQAYFGSKSWYVPMYDPDAFDEEMESYLNDYELADLNVILAYEEALNG